MEVKIVNALSDLGVDVDGTCDGPLVISKNLKGLNSININKINTIKSKDKKDLKKNLESVNAFNRILYDNVLKIMKDRNFPIIIGGDHSVSIGSALASQKVNKNLGIIWIDAHIDYNTFETTITGNMHGLPLAAINGICGDLTKFYNGDYINPKNTVVVGYRANEENKEKELDNIKKMGVTVYTCEDIKKYGIQSIMNKAINIATLNTNGIHVSFDLDVIDPELAPGVSIPEKDGINLKDLDKIVNTLKDNINIIKSFDLVEFNPRFDIDNKTLNIALRILNSLIEKIKDYQLQ